MAYQIDYKKTEEGYFLMCEKTGDCVTYSISEKGFTWVSPYTFEVITRKCCSLQFAVNLFAALVTEANS